VTTQRRGVGALLLGFTLATCGPPADPIRTDVDSVQQRTLPPGGRLVVPAVLTRRTQSVQASWRLETEMSWRQYAPWVESQLREFRVAERADGRLRLSRQLAGDLYVVELVAAPGSAPLTVEASFVATPF
jgi:hypothetical protein